jgi:hypothetical protein
MPTRLGSFVSHGDMEGPGFRVIRRKVNYAFIVLPESYLHPNAARRRAALTLIAQSHF